MNNMFDSQILLLLILLPVMAFLAISHWIQNINTEKIAGEMIAEISMTSKQKIFNCSFRFVVGFLILYLFPQIRGMSRPNNLGGLIYLTISIIGALLFVLVYNRKQKIYTRGILNEQGLFLWNNIKNVKMSDKQSDIILVFLHEPVSKENCIKLKCNPAEIQRYIRLIENQIEKSDIT